MPPASSHGLRSDTLSSGRIIVQPPAIFKSLRLSRSALFSTSRSTLTVRHTHGQTTRAMSLPGPNANSGPPLRTSDLGCDDLRLRHSPAGQSLPAFSFSAADACHSLPQLRLPDELPET